MSPGVLPLVGPDPLAIALTPAHAADAAGSTATEQYPGQPLERAGKSVDLDFRPEDCIIVPADS